MQSKYSDLSHPVEYYFMDLQLAKDLGLLGIVMHVLSF